MLEIDDSNKCLECLPNDLKLLYDSLNKSLQRQKKLFYNEILSHSPLLPHQSNKISQPIIRKLSECQCEARIWLPGSSGNDRCSFKAKTNGLCNKHAPKAAEGETPCIVRDGKPIGLFCGRITVSQDGEEGLPPYKAEGECRILWNNPEVRKRIQEQALPIWDRKAVRKANSKK